MQACKVCRIASQSVGLIARAPQTKLSTFWKKQLIFANSSASFGVKACFATLADSKEEEYDWDPKNEDESIASKSTSPSGNKKDSQMKETQHKLLHEALEFVQEHGWGPKALSEAAKSLDLSSAIVGSFEYQDAALVYYFLDLKMVDLENYLIDLRTKHVNEFGRIKINLFISDACKQMLGYVIPYLQQWPTALTILAEPQNSVKTLKHHAEMVDLIWHYAGDTSMDYNWYSKRILLSGVINSTQLHLLQDKSPDYQDTWHFLEDRLQDVAAIGMNLGKMRENLSSFGILLETIAETGKNVLGLPNLRR